MGEQIGGRLDQVAARRQIEDPRGCACARRQRRPEGEQRLAGQNAPGIEAQACVRRVMGGELARRHRGDAVLERILAVRRGLGQRVPERPLDLGARQAARPQQDRPVEAGHDGGFDADRRRAAVDDQVDAAAQIGQHMRRGGRRDMAGAGRWRHHRLAEFRQDGAGDRVIGHSAARWSAARRSPAPRPRNRAAWDHQGERPRPQGLRQPLRIGIEAAEPAGRRQVLDMADERIERGPALGLIEPRHRLAVAGIGAEPIDGLGREGDEAARGEAARRGLHRRLAGADDAGHRFGGHVAFRVRAVRWRAALAAMPGRRYKTGLQSECSAVW